MRAAKTREAILTRAFSAILLSCLGLFVALFPGLAYGDDKAIIRLLKDANHAAQARYAVATKGTRELLQMVYVFDHDGTAFLNAAVLREQALAGANVYLLIDAFSAGHRVSNAILKHLHDCGVHIKIYNPLNRWQLLRYLRRMHDKLILANRRFLVTGGRNVGNNYTGFNMDAWRDMDIYVESWDVARDARTYFFRIFNSRYVVDPDFSGVTPEEVLEAKGLLDRALELGATSPILHPADGIDWTSNKTYRARAEFLSFGLDENGDRLPVPTKLPALLEAAQRRIHIVTPYFAPPAELEKLLRPKGNITQIITNSYEANNQKLVAHYYRASLRRYAKMGFEIIEMGGVTTHTKAMAIDDIGLVGTFNADPISWFKNLEMGIAVHSAEFANDLVNILETDYVNHGVLVARGGSLTEDADPFCPLWLIPMYPLRNHL